MSNVPTVPSLPLLRQAVRLRRLSAAASPYEIASQGPVLAFGIVPLAATQTAREREWNQRSFSAQLLDLGLTHRVEGLVRKAEGHAITETKTSAEHARGSYENAQNNFVPEAACLFRWQA